jgi:hypothetical protein
MFKRAAAGITEETRVNKPGPTNGHIRIYAPTRSLPIATNKTLLFTAI